MNARLNIFWRCALGLGLLSFCLSANGVPLAARTRLDFHQTMEVIQQGLAMQGYEVVHVQRCDGALERLDYKSDFYRVILFGKLEQVRQITHEFPALASLFPLRITVFAAGTETIVSAINPLDILEITENDTLEPVFKQWHQDLLKLFARVNQGNLANDEAGLATAQ